MNSTPFTDENIRDTLFLMAHDITTQEQASTNQFQAVTTQSNREVVTLAQEHVATMASRLRHFTRINPPTFYGSMVEEDP